MIHDDNKPTQAPRPLMSLNILVVDDETILCEIVRDFLTGEGHHVSLAFNGREGAEKFARDTFDVVLSDKVMPEMCGEELALTVKRMSPDTPVIMVTAYRSAIPRTGQKTVGR